MDFKKGRKLFSENFSLLYTYINAFRGEGFAYNKFPAKGLIQSYQHPKHSKNGKLLPFIQNVQQIRSGAQRLAWIALMKKFKNGQKNQICM